MNSRPPQASCSQPVAARCCCPRTASASPTRGTVVFLDATVDQQLQRTRHGRHRPLLATADPRARLEELMRVREPLYRSIAAITVRTDGRKLRSVAGEIAQALSACRRIDLNLGSRQLPDPDRPGPVGHAGPCSPSTRAMRNSWSSATRPSRRCGCRACARALRAAAFAQCLLPDGEEHKTLATVARVIDALVEARMNRDCMVLALGGGVIGDIAGFAAACYQRGVATCSCRPRCWRRSIPPIGGKTGVNHPGGKNLIGAFHQPMAVITDTDTLGTLPDRELRAGLAEVIKSALIADAAFFAWLEAEIDALLARDPEALAEAIRRACESRPTSSPATSASRARGRC